MATTPPHSASPVETTATSAPTQLENHTAEMQEVEKEHSPLAVEDVEAVVTASPVKESIMVEVAEKVDEQPVEEIATSVQAEDQDSVETQQQTSSPNMENSNTAMEDSASKECTTTAAKTNNSQPVEEKSALVEIEEEQSEEPTQDFISSSSREDGGDDDAMTAISPTEKPNQTSEPEQVNTQSTTGKSTPISTEGLSTESQDTLPPSIPAIDSNDTIVLTEKDQPTQAEQLRTQQQQKEEEVIRHVFVRPTIDTTTIEKNSDEHSNETAEEEEEEEEEGSDDFQDDDTDLGTPLGYGGSADFGEGSDDFAVHCFYGPSIPGDDGSAPALHGLRRAQLHAKPPRFTSEVDKNAIANGDLQNQHQKQIRRSTSATDTSSRSKSPFRSYSLADHPSNSYSVTFTQPTLGFKTHIVVSEDNELMVHVANVDSNSPAGRNGVAVGDLLVSVNGQHIEPHMTESEALEIISTASSPRTLLFLRADPEFHESPPKESKSLGYLDQSSTKKKQSKLLMGRFSSAVSIGSSLIGQAWKRKKSVVHANAFCDGCGMDPIIGPLWTCSVCTNYNLCGECYDLGTHGMENTEQMQLLSEAIVAHKLQKKCKQFTPDFLLSLRRDICKGRPDKFEYMGGWIAEIVIGTAASKITVRGIEIPSLTPSARQRFVAKLMPLVSNRTDIEVNIEWLPDDTERASVDMDDACVAADHEELEKLRIWISDKKTRTTSPFA